MNYNKLVNHICAWLKQRFQLAGKTVAVVGVSGGIDSAVVSTLCAMAGLRVRAISMPVRGKGSPLAQVHLDFLLELYPESVEAHVSDIGLTLKASIQEFNQKPDGLQLANLQSRIRMTRLYLFASNDGLVVGTGNKVEDFGLGFFTKYGDGGVDLSPIGNLLKSEVRMVARTLFLNPDIINVTPTDGLWEPGSGHDTDEEALGITYNEAEEVLKLHELLTELGSDISVADAKKHIADPIVELNYGVFRHWHDSTRHKMSMPPVCIIPEDIYD